MGKKINRVMVEIEGRTESVTGAEIYVVLAAVKQMPLYLIQKIRPAKGTVLYAEPTSLHLY